MYGGPTSNHHGHHFPRPHKVAQPGVHGQRFSPERARAVRVDEAVVRPGEAQLGFSGLMNYVFLYVFVVLFECFFKCFPNVSQGYFQMFSNVFVFQVFLNVFVKWFLNVFFRVVFNLFSNVFFFRVLQVFFRIFQLQSWQTQLKKYRQFIYSW